MQEVAQPALAVSSYDSCATLLQRRLHTGGCVDAYLYHRHDEAPLPGTFHIAVPSHCIL